MTDALTWPDRLKLYAEMLDVVLPALEVIAKDGHPVAVEAVTQIEPMLARALANQPEGAR